ncbi:MAG: sel1 repeat family protein [Magnetococcales bacterium]|nr:sel1 repeat family protein [Magnetococcales bacterium]
MRKLVQVLAVTLSLASAVGYAETGDIERLREAAEQGDVKAQVRMGWIYHEGRGVPQSDSKAATWYLKAAEKGDVAAQTLIALMLALGEGVPQNDGLADFWFRKAALQSPPDTRYQIETLRNSIGK